MKKIMMLLIAVLFVAGCTNTSTTDTSERMSRGNYNFFEAEDPFGHFEKDYSE